MIVPADREGVTLEDDWDGIGQSLTGTGTTRLDTSWSSPTRCSSCGCARTAPPALRLPAALSSPRSRPGSIRNAAEDAAALVRSREGRPFAHAPASARPTIRSCRRSSARSSAPPTRPRRRCCVAAEALRAEPDSVARRSARREALRAGSLEAAKAKVVSTSSPCRDDADLRRRRRLGDQDGRTSTVTGATPAPSRPTTRCSTRRRRSGTSRSTVPRCPRPGSSGGTMGGLTSSSIETAAQPALPETHAARGYAAGRPRLASGPALLRAPGARPARRAIEILYCGVCHSDLHRPATSGRGPSTRGARARDRRAGPRGRRRGHAVQGRRPRRRRLPGRFLPRRAPPAARASSSICERGSTVTYNGTETATATTTYGGYSSAIVVRRAFVLRIPDELDPRGAAPLLCAGITTYSPLRHWGRARADRSASSASAASATWR